MGKKCKVKLDVGTVYQKEEGGTYYFLTKAGMNANASA